MNPTARALAALLALSLSAWAQSAPGGTTGPINHNDTRVHPGFTMTSLVPPGAPANWPRVSGMDFLPNGDLAVSTWDGFGNSAGTTRPGRVYVFKNVQTGDSNQVTYAQLGANDMNEPLGLKVVNGEIYIIEKDSLVHLVDENKDQTLDSKRKIASGWSRNLSDNSGKDLQFMHGLVHTANGKFIAGMATRWNSGGPATSTGVNANHDGCIISMETGRTDYDVVACGIRSPDGIVLGPEDGIFVTDNNGNWVPASKLVHVKQGRFFNVFHTPASPYESTTVSRPVLWLPHGNNLTNVSVSPTQPVFLRSGTFKGQMLAGDNNFGTLQRYFLEKVNGEFQGAVFRFSGGLRAAAHRMITGPDGAVYIGEIGATSTEWSGWWWNSRQHGLHRLTETAPFFDVLSVRSTGESTFDIHFTEPLVSAEASNFLAPQQWAYVPVFTYGGGKQATETLSITSVVLSSDKKTVTLTIPGLKRSNVVHLRWTGLTAASGRPLMTDRAWYTLNEFGPGIVVGVKPAPAQRINLGGAKALSDGRIQLTLAVEGVPGSASVYDMQGALLETLETGSGRLVSRKAYRPGVYAVIAGQGAQRVSYRVTVL